MTFAVQTLIEKSAYENGWENRVSPLVFASARHPGTLRVREGDKVLIIELDDAGGNSALSAAFPTYVSGGVLELPYAPPQIAEHLPLLALFFKTAAELCVGRDTVATASTTIRAAEVAQRVGQQLYRTAQLALWGNACAVTGLTLTDLVRASHAKPWARCSDEERLDCHNGLPLASHLDALFDAGYISFTDSGTILLASALDTTAQQIFGLATALHLRQPLTQAHFPFFDYHRRYVFRP